ncbi:MAG TPA: tripartite tricarboxylate transporter substrate binding protein [Burkholderiales bacterium]|nr:tripartite tricarboxylate transporter substrate binding protein [Burkholderiales bacterium]
MLRIVAVSTLLAVPCLASAQAYPSRPIRMIVASTPGSGVDIVSRMMATRMSETLKSTLVVDNRAGAGGTIGCQITAKAPPDGYTILMAAPSMTINALLVKPAPYDAVRDFAAIGQATTSHYVIVVNPSLPVKNVKELIALARAKPGQLNYGSGGNGNSTHLAGEYFKGLTGTDIVHVAYKGSGPAIVDLIGGQVQVMFANVVAVLTHMRSGKLRALATTGPKRAAATPDLPTVAESGVPGYVVTSWFGLVAPAHTRDAQIAKLNAALVSALQDRETIDRLAADGAEPAAGTPDAFSRHIAAELAIWGKVMKASGL